MFEWIKAIILGVIEGVTEFLPISSTGHLILANEFLSFDQEFENLFNVVIQLGAILSVIVLFRRKLIPFGRDVGRNERKRTFDLWKRVIVGVLPAIVFGVLLGDLIEEALFNPVVVAVALAVGGVLILWIESRDRTPRLHTVDDIGCRTAFFIGLIQCLAMIPGTSRSACTIIGAMLLGASRVAAAEFSFFLAVPTMVCASGYSLLKSGFALSTQESLLLAVGFAVSFLVALLVIAAFMKLIQRVGFKPFGYYRIALGIVILLYFFLIK